MNLTAGPLGAAALLVLALPSAATAAEPWRAPVAGQVLRAFHTVPERFARGQHRGVDLAAAPGTAVRAACSGRVHFAGRVPGGGRTVSVRCGRLLATYQHLGTVAVRRGRPVLAGLSLGTAGRSGTPRGRRPHVHLGARELATGRYVDPLTLMRSSPPARPLAPPAKRPPRHPLVRGPGPAGPSPRPTAIRAPIAIPAGGPASHPASARASHPAGALASHPARPPALPWAAWAGLGCLAAALPLGAVTRRRRRRAPAGPARSLSRPAS